MEKKKELRVPLWEKYQLTINEASEYFNIGEKKLRTIISNDLDANWLRRNGERLMIIRHLFEEYILETPTY